MIDNTKDVYLFLHGKKDLKYKAIKALISKEISGLQIVIAEPDKVGKVGDYMAVLWFPPNPDHIKIQQITKVEDVIPEGMIGLWKGVTAKDLFRVEL